ncbi:MAG TPA: helical backbone metal receptor [Puia sp.]|jgi:ABC-type Fe3+-hydroxamate transport system substrate-binding protein|nr:helical backbone metal receptor [Puia sp.]
MRIISLVPSLTELLFDLGLDEEVVGITKFCVHPDKWFHNKTRVGGTKNIRTEVIHELNPDLIIANKEENTKEQIEKLAENYQVWVTDIKTLDSAMEMLKNLGELTNRNLKANLLTVEIREGFAQLKKHLEIGHRKLRTGYLIWRNPYMVAGGDTFINNMMDYCGFENTFKKTSRYPQITIEELSLTHCELLLLSSEPFPFKQKHIASLQPQLPDTKIILVDGEMFSWYGSRLLYAPGYFLELIKDLQR